MASDAVAEVHPPLSALMRLRQRLRADVEPARIVDGLWLGSAGAARNTPRLTELGITAIVCVAKGMEGTNPNDFAVHTVDISDHPQANIGRHFESCCAFIDHHMPQGVLVHCLQGRSRSVTVVVAYLMRRYKWSMPCALEYVRERRDVAQPNVGFVAALLRCQRAWVADGVVLHDTPVFPIEPLSPLEFPRVDPVVELG